MTVPDQTPAGQVDEKMAEGIDAVRRRMIAGERAVELQPGLDR
jgi:hypothetical protein